MDLSLITDWLEKAGDWMIDWWWVTLLAAVGAAILYYLAYRATVGAELWHRERGPQGFHKVEGWVWPITWTIVVVILVIRGGLRFLFRLGDVAEELTKRIRQPSPT